MVKICEDGVLKYKARDLVGDDFPLVGRDTGKGKGMEIRLNKNVLTNIF